MARRDTSDSDRHRPDLEGMVVAGQPPHPTTAFCDADGQAARIPSRRLISWNGGALTGVDIPDFKGDETRQAAWGPFIMNPEGVARFFAGGHG